MSKYSLNADDEFEPGSNNKVLRNLLGITDPHEMNQAETHALASAYDESLDSISTDEPITKNLVCQLHSRWLGTIYPFAGKFRTVNVSKNNLMFCLAMNIEPQLLELEAGFLRSNTPCRAESIKDLALTLSEVHAELILIHPFREGNGRTCRWVADLMAIQAGFLPPRYDLEYTDDSPERAAYFAAMRRSFLGDLTKLSELFDLWLRMAQPDAV